MSSEEMRTELEVFVNQGLQQGWRGWPRHDSRGCSPCQRNEGQNGTYGTDRTYGTSHGCEPFYWSYGSN